LAAEIVETPSLVLYRFQSDNTPNSSPPAAALQKQRVFPASFDHKPDIHLLILTRIS